MNFIVFDSYQAMCKTEAERIAHVVANNPTALLCLAAGHTSLGVFDELVMMYQRGEVSFSQASFVAMDEWQGMSVETDGSCGDFLQKHFISKVDFKAVRYVDGTADPKAECESLKAYIQDGIDHLLLGIGMNGHLALNEPNTPFDSTVHATVLDEVTKTVGIKYFDGNTPLLNGGITIGIGDMVKARDIVLCANGSKKVNILHRMLNDEISPALPATVLRTLDHASVYCDKDAAQN